MTDVSISVAAGWTGICAGCIAGALQGLFFHKESWLGGYNSWQRRMLRLGHISLVAIGFINLGFALTVVGLGLVGLRMGALLLIVGAVTMPLLCYIAAFYKQVRHLFFIPAVSLIVASGMVAWKVAFR